MTANKSRLFSIDDLRKQCQEIAQKFNQGEKVDLIDVFCLLEQLIIQLDESQFPAKHRHKINLTTCNFE